MRTWSVPVQPSMAFRLAADSRLSRPDYVNDQCWEFRSSAGDPPALCFSTTYGLRAREMRLFVAFGREAEYVTDPAQFASPPILKQVFPNYLSLQFAPFSRLEARLEVWVPDSHSLAGRVRLTNLDGARHRARLVLHAAFLPGENPEPMHEAMAQGVNLLVGRTADLVPVVFLAGGASPAQAAHPALAVTFELEPGEGKAVGWAEVALGSMEESFLLARELVGRPWDEEIARLEMVNHGQVEIESGDPDWDFALKMAQQAALGSFVGPTPHLPHRSFVCVRAPDRGHSARGDGGDHPLGWDGQSVQDVYAIVPMVLPAAPDWAKGLVLNYLAVQSADGAIDGRPGLGGQRSKALAAPLLASLTWRIYQHTEDRPFLEACFDRLLEFLDAWFTPAHDRDQDGFPEWDHTVQAGFDDWPTFAPWGDWGQGLELTKAETPDLGAYLYRECLSLMEAARELGRGEVVARLKERAERLRARVRASWSGQTATYHHLDRDLHVSPNGELLGEGVGEFTVRLERDFSPGARVLVRCRGPEAEAASLKVTIKGRATRGRGTSERLTRVDCRWFWGQGSATSNRAYASLQEITVRGLSAAFLTWIFAADYSRQDATVLLPLWAGIPEGQRAGILIDRALLDPKRFWCAFGIASNAASDPAFSPDHRTGVGAVQMSWNEMLGEGLLAYGRRAEAAELTRRLMAAAAGCVRRHGGFRRWYRPDDGAGFGEADHPAGLPPLPLFLSCLGVRLITPRKVRLEGSNPFPWPVTIRWRGLEVRRESGSAAVVVFPDGERVQVSGEEARTVEQAPSLATS